MRLFRLTGLGAALAVTTVIAGQTGAPLGSTQQVNVATLINASYPDVASDASGRSTVVWQLSTDTDGNGTVDERGIALRSYNADGQPLGGQMLVHDRGTLPQVASNASGRTVVVWQDDYEYTPIIARIYNPDGSPATGAFTLDAMGGTTNELTLPDVTVAADGSFTVAYQIRNGAGYSVYGRRFSAEGTALGARFIIKDNNASLPHIAGTGTGAFVVTWIALTEDSDGNGSNDGSGIQARLYDAAGLARGPAFDVPSVRLNNQTQQSVSMNASGAFGVIWRSQLDATLQARARLFDANGIARGNEFEVSSAASRNIYSNYEFYPDIALKANGDFAAVWRDTTGGLYQRYYAADGTPRFAETRFTDAGNAVRVAIGGGGDYLVVNTEGTLSASGGGQVLLNRYAGTATVDLAIAVGDSPDPVSPGSPVQYSVYVSNLNAVPTVTGVAATDAANLAAATARGASVQFSLNGAAYISAAGAGWTCTGTIAVSCAYAGGLPPGATAPLLTIAAQGVPSATSITATASVTEGHADPVPANNSATQVTAISSGSTGPGPDTVPDGYSFIDAANVARSTVTASNAITVTGINQAAPISVAGGEYQIGSGAWTSAAGSINNGQTVRLRHTSAAGFSAETLSTLTLGGVSAVFRSVTLAQVTTPQAFTFATQSGVEPSVAFTSNPVAISGINSAAPISVSGGEYAINGGAFTAAAGTVNNGDTVQLRVTSGPYSESRSATLIVGGTSGSFTTVTRAAPDAPVAPPIVVKNSGGAFDFISLSVLALLGMVGGLRRRRV